MLLKVPPPRQAGAAPSASAYFDHRHVVTRHHCYYYRAYHTQVTLVLWSVAGVPAGYTAARLYRQMHGQRAYLLIGLTISLFPGLMFTAFFGLDAVLWAQDLHKIVIQ